MAGIRIVHGTDDEAGVPRTTGEGRTAYAPVPGRSCGCVFVRVSSPAHFRLWGFSMSASSPTRSARAAARVHAGRAAGRDRDHRRARGAAVARRAIGPRVGPPHAMRQPHQAVDARHAQLSRHESQPAGLREKQPAARLGLFDVALRRAAGLVRPVQPGAALLSAAQHDRRRQCRDREPGRSDRPTCEDLLLPQRSLRRRADRAGRSVLSRRGELSTELGRRAAARSTARHRQPAARTGGRLATPISPASAGRAIRG